MNIRIDPETGSIVDSSFVIPPGLRRGMLKSVQPKTFRMQDGGVIRVAEGCFNDKIIGIFARDRDGGIETYELLAYQRGDSWDNWTSEGEEERRKIYHAILAASGIGDREIFLWGRAEVLYDHKNLTYSLQIEHRLRHAVSAP